MAEIILTCNYIDEDEIEQTFGWTTADHDQAMNEGWYLDHEDGAFQVDNERSPNKARRLYDHVRKKASEGSLMHIKAMLLDNRATRLAWEDRMNDALRMSSR